jgi:hypothetical protein
MPLLHNIQKPILEGYYALCIFFQFILVSICICRNLVAVTSFHSIFLYSKVKGTCAKFAGVNLMKFVFAIFRTN